MYITNTGLTTKGTAVKWSSMHRHTGHDQRKREALWPERQDRTWATRPVEAHPDAVEMMVKQFRQTYKKETRTRESEAVKPSERAAASWIGRQGRKNRISRAGGVSGPPGFLKPRQVSDPTLLPSRSICYMH